MMQAIEGFMGFSIFEDEDDEMRHKGSADPLLVGGEGLFDNGCFFW
jgi:hypothetical protein